MRWTKTGAPDTPLTIRGKGMGTVTPDGYMRVFAPGHPLASSSRPQVLLHRKVLYDAIGPGPHPCHWCGVHLTWSPALTVDHVNGDRLDNTLPNLVVACRPCNSSRRTDGNPEQWAPRDYAEVAALHEQGFSTRQIARRVGLDASYVSRIITARAAA